jgi:CspA family cold shock protein
MAKTAQQRATMTGTIRTLKTANGFGFIEGADGEQYFFHRSAALEFDSLIAGDTVKFIPSQGPKGLRAESVVEA